MFTQRLIYASLTMVFVVMLPIQSHATKQVFWGDLHVHTSYSADAYIFGNQSSDPAAAYSFATGSPITLADGRSVTIDRPLDFMAVTDHAEYFDLMNMCVVPGTPQYASPYCTAFRTIAANAQSNHSDGFNMLISPARIQAHLMYCNSNPGVCDTASDTTWQSIQSIANNANNQPNFTAFIAHEWSGANTDVMQAANRLTLHRNLIYANEFVPTHAIDFIHHPRLADMWTALDTQCTNAQLGGNCEVLAIPHNSNQSGGESFNLQYQGQGPAEWRQRARYEKLVEIFQGKGNSECLNKDPADNNMDCKFELRFDDPNPAAHWAQLRRGYVRTALGFGLKHYVSHNLGYNPLKMGFIGSTDTHNSTGGKVQENAPTGNHGYGDNTPIKRLSSKLQNNPGGLVAVWAAANTRADIFDALKRRETYATSGTRITVKFYQTFAPGNLCSGTPAPAWTPMGGNMVSPPPGPNATPRFVAIAAMDLTKLARIDIIKVWLKANGDVAEMVHSMDAEDAVNGDATLCFIVDDINFSQSRPALWYARVLEVPTKRWSKWDCESILGGCNNYPDADKYIQERAWTSPIWHLP